MKVRPWLGTLLLLALFLVSIFRFELLEALLRPLVRTGTGAPLRAGLPELALQHLVLVLLAGSFSVLTGVVLGFLAVLSRGRDFRNLLVGLSSFTETLPSVAVIALAVPVLGYGTGPTLLALCLYGILPVLRNTIDGLEGVDGDIVEAARGMGMNEARTLFSVRAPVALPVILAGVRVSLIVTISAATLGAAVGAGGFGVPIVSGIRSFDPLMILRGAVPVSLMALFADSLLRRAAEAAGGWAVRSGSL